MTAETNTSLFSLPFLGLLRVTFLLTLVSINREVLARGDEGRVGFLVIENTVT